MSFNEVDRAQVLAEALPLQKYYGKTIVSSTAATP